MFGPRIEEDRVRWQASSMIDEGIAAFWEAWPTVRPLLEAELAAGEYGEGTSALTDLTEAIEPHLEWELMAGQSSDNALCVSSAADPRLRLVAQRWVDSAPRVDS